MVGAFGSAILVVKACTDVPVSGVPLYVTALLDVFSVEGPAVEAAAASPRLTVGSFATDSGSVVMDPGTVVVDVPALAPVGCGVGMLDVGVEGLR